MNNENVDPSILIPKGSGNCSHRHILNTLKVIMKTSYITDLPSAAEHSEVLTCTYSVSSGVKFVPSQDMFGVV